MIIDNFSITWLFFEVYEIWSNSLKQPTKQYSISSQGDHNGEDDGCVEDAFRPIWHFSHGTSDLIFISDDLKVINGEKYVR